MEFSQKGSCHFVTSEFRLQRFYSETFRSNCNSYLSMYLRAYHQHGLSIEISTWKCCSKGNFLYLPTFGWMFRKCNSGKNFFLLFLFEKQWDENEMFWTTKLISPLESFRKHFGGVLVPSFTSFFICCHPAPTYPYPEWSKDPFAG